MKAYLFNTENGLYEGETFEGTDTLAYVDGITTIPPPDYQQGEVPIFDCQKNEWTVIPITMARQLLRLTTDTDTES